MSHVDSFVKRSWLCYNINRAQNAIKECQFSSEMLSRTIPSLSTQTPHWTWQFQHVCSCLYCIFVGSPRPCDCQHPASHWRWQPVQHWVHLLLQFGCGCKYFFSSTPLIEFWRFILSKPTDPSVTTILGLLGVAVGSITGLVGGMSLPRLSPTIKLMESNF